MNISSFFTPAKGLGISWNCSQHNTPNAASWGDKPANPTAADCFCQAIIQKNTKITMNNLTGHANVKEMAFPLV